MDVNIRLTIECDLIYATESQQAWKGIWIESEAQLLNA